MVEPKIGSVELDSAGWMVTSQIVPRTCASVSVADVPGRGYADMTARPRGSAPAKVMKVYVTLEHYDADDATVESDIESLWSSVSGRELEYRPWDMGGRTYMGVWTLEVVGRRHRGATVKMTGLCDGVAYGGTAQKSLSSGSNSMSVAGTAPAYPKFELTATGGAVSVQVGTSKTELLESVASGSSVVIDSSSMTCKVAGASKRIKLSSDWPMLAPGQTTVKLSGCSGTVEYRERWY